MKHLNNGVKLILIFTLAAMVMIGCSDQSSSKQSDDNSDNIKLTTDTEKPYVGFLLDTLQDERWYKDKQIFEEQVTELGGNVKTLAANGNDQIQITQAELLIEEGVDVLVVVPKNADTSATIVEMAHDAGVKVISYDRLIKNADLDYYISFDNEKVGELQASQVIKHTDEGNFAYIGGAETDNNAKLLRQGAMSVLQPLMDEGKVNLIYDNYTKNWDPTIAESKMQKVLEQNNSNVDAVVAANDGTAGGAINALSNHGLAGDIPVSGQDAELSALQRIVAGTQTVTIYKPIQLLAKNAAEMAIQVANNESIKTENTINNGAKDVPTSLLEPIAVTEDNIDETIIADGYYTTEEIYGQK
ncbi:sugar ABC transporter substrate-binding protein [Virgibacillus sp. MSP4-1]|uniref:sugar ABC transporter substrate-binding protein n=1 Tax=Virgibacillus sp. MSP4-1 TaxID=2700081 RepID=UPI00039ED093|nr:substrate-binding domain-containing protein [Virgibacillus sp. MSP4-1]QHS23687.1 sugar ABC transporter substrate-binding protein [Virgibacillus sp. MSP4-1]